MTKGGQRRGARLLNELSMSNLRPCTLPTPKNAIKDGYSVFPNGRNTCCLHGGQCQRAKAAAVAAISTSSSYTTDKHSHYEPVNTSLPPTFIPREEINAGTGYERVFCTSPENCPTSKSSRSTTSVGRRKKLKGIYLGGLTPPQAEERLPDRVSFRLYHRLPDPNDYGYEELKQSCDLFLIYRSLDGKYFHFPIIGNCSSGETGPDRTFYMVNYGKSAPSFSSLDALVSFYQMYSSSVSNNPTHDLFPVKSSRSFNQ